MTKELRKKNRVNKRFERFIKRNPELKKIDTVIIEIPKVEIDTFVSLNFDTLKLDSIVYLIKDTTIRSIVRKYITNEVYPNDTLKQFIDGFNFAFWFTDGNLNYSVEKPLETIKKPVEVFKKVELTFIEQAQNLFTKFWRWFVLLLIFTVILYFIKKTLFNR
tara:strand:- start:113 stop:598 length:486 start_codon:yes stop_codon:yes gene_type:complete